jgi:hypothetical protein
VYVAAPDGVLRAGGQNADQQLPPFTGSQVRVAPDILNPFLVVINAEMTFQRFKRHPHSLCDEYTELVDFTISLVEKIYFQPLVYEINMERNTCSIRKRCIGRHAWEVWISLEQKLVTTNIKPSIERTREVFQNWVVERPGPGASLDKIIEYHQYPMFGQGMTTLLRL